MSNEVNGKSAPKKDRYWSVMLVGDRGRVIPFRHFKGIALTVCCISFLLLVAIIVMSILYINQGRKLASLNSKLEEAQLQNSKLRDEKDLYLTKLMLTQKQEKKAAETPKSDQPPALAESKPEEKKEKVEAEAQVKPVAPVEKKAAAAKPPAPKVQWKADIRRFSVSYDTAQEVLKAQFRVYNTSRPKKRLSGRSVVVFKVQDEPPVKWIPVPRVQLNTGEPSGTRGQSFRVKNYLTMKFRAYRQKAPIQFNAATVYIFGEDGKMLASKDFAFKIETPPPPPPPPKKQPAPSPPAVTKEQPAETTAPPAVKPSQDKVPPATVGPEDSGAEIPAPVPGTGQVPGTDPPPTQPEQDAEAAKPSDTVDTPPPSEPAAGASDIPTQTETPTEADKPETAPQPKVEGETR